MRAQLLQPKQIQRTRRPREQGQLTFMSSTSKLNQPSFYCTPDPLLAAACSGIPVPKLYQRMTASRGTHVFVVCVFLMSLGVPSFFRGVGGGCALIFERTLLRFMLAPME